MTEGVGEPRYPYVHVECTPDKVDELSALLFELGAEGVEERDEGTLAKSSGQGLTMLVASFATRADAEEAIAELRSSDEFPSLAPHYEEIVGDAWRDAWKEHYRPFKIAQTAGGRVAVVVKPPWENYDAKPGEHVLELEPGRAFGTGLHETTRLVAQALADHESDLKGDNNNNNNSITMLDVGCGSGVLALIALCLGAARAIAIDVDPDAILVTRENAERNAMTDRIQTIVSASLDEETARGSCPASSPVVVANIEARVLIPMAEELSRHVAPGGLLLLSGILVPQRDDVRAAYSSMELLNSPALGEWTLLALRRPSA